MALSKVGKHHASEAISALATVQQGCFALGTTFAGAIYSYSIIYGYVNAISISIGVLSLLVLTIGIPIYMKTVGELDCQHG
ncbi:hypothetical protein L4D04_21165 [Photobacterium angustum]|uniref:hypothetical protein n=1 Tax=Photobacterium angustum TaxID=661 RepID=UPI003D121F5F